MQATALCVVSVYHLVCLCYPHHRSVPTVKINVFTSSASSVSLPLSPSLCLSLSATADRFLLLLLSLPACPQPTAEELDFDKAELQQAIAASMQATAMYAVSVDHLVCL